MGRSCVVVICFVLVVACGGDGATTDSARGVADATRCLDAPPLLGLRLGDSIAAIRSRLGAPVAAVRSATRELGGPVLTYRFPRADVQVVGGRVQRIVATERGGWPRGLGVGSTGVEVDRYAAQHRISRTATRGAMQIRVCPDDLALLHFTPSANGRRVSRVELVAGGP